MHEQIDTLADVISLKDRESSDIALAAAIPAVLQPEGASTYPVLGQPNKER